MSIQLELKVTTGKPIVRGHDHYWSVIKDIGKSSLFTLREIAQRSNDRDDRAISDFLRRLTKAGFIQLVDQKKVAKPTGGTNIHNVYQLVRRQAVTPIVNRDGSIGTQGLAQLYMWNAMRNLTQFDKAELAISATTDEVSVAIETSRRYARYLQNAGYLQIRRPGGSGVARIWRLKPSMNTGPNPPKILSCRAVYDANLQKIMGNPVAVECAA